jgi:YHS domain-containing protein
MLRLILIGLLILFLARAFWRLVDGIIEGVAGPRPNVPDRTVPMVRDPICGTFVVPGRAVQISERGGEVYFCSTTCRDKYRSRSG